MRTGKIRTVRREHRFDLELDYIEPNVRRADEFLEGAESILARDPEAGYPVEEGSSVWFVGGHTVDAALYYTFDADHVYFLSIKRTKMPEL